MGGRGRGRGGRGGGGMSFNVEFDGFRRGDQPQVSQLTPPPLFPDVASRPVPFEEDEELKYLQVLKEDFRATMSKSPHFLKADEVKTSIERYSDQFKSAVAAAVAADEEEEQRLWHMPDKFFPAELTAIKLKKGKKRKKKGGDPADLASKLDELEKKEGVDDEDEEDDETASPSKVKKKTAKDYKDPAAAAGEGDGDDDEEEDEETEGEGDGVEADEEEEEEDIGGGDYRQTYFDNGEEEGNVSDDNLDEGGVF